MRTVFALLGSAEDDMTRSTGWALARSPAFLAAVLARLAPGHAPGSAIGVRLQEGSEHGGYTDVEIETEQLFFIIEAKRGWTLPSRRQLELYAPRLALREKHGGLVVVSECSREYAVPRLPTDVGGTPVLYASWEEIVHLAAAAAVSSGWVEKRLLAELGDYLEGLIHMQDQQSNLVYVVVLAEGTPEWSTMSWRDFVRVKRQYFHPYGKAGWPVMPPNYLGFRWQGRLRSIHHVESYEIVDPLYAKLPEIIPEKWGEAEGEYVLYALGPGIAVPGEVKNGPIYPNARLTAAIDLLLTSETIADAVRLTKERLGSQ